MDYPETYVSRKKRVAMLYFHPRRFGWVLVLVLGLWVVTVQAQAFRYRCVSLDQVEPPSGFTFFGAAAIQNSGRLYGNVCDDSGLECYVAFYKDGTVTVLPSPVFFVFVVNERGTVGGFVPIDFENGLIQAALFHGDAVELIPPQPGEVSSDVFALNDSGTALVESFDDSGEVTYLLYHQGRTTTLDFGPSVINPSANAINNQGIISGTQGSSAFDSATGFRFNPRTDQTTLLYPLSTEPLAWGLDINNRGNVLGYSFVSNGLERIGVWNRKGKFKTYFVEGIPEFPTISNRLLFNDNNLIIITNVSSPASERGNSYLVPKPGVRLNVADLVENLPEGQDLRFMVDINNNGSMIGFGSQGNFLLERMGR
jgi:hypothetical protein